jgi:multidrug efflux pump subunit AcrB
VRDGPYTRTLRGALGRPALTLGVAVLALVGGAALIPVVGVSLFPKAEKPFFLVDVTTDEGTSLDRTDAVVADVERWLAEQPEVAHLAANVGRGHPQAYYNVYPRRERPTVGQILVETHDARDVDGLARRVLREVVVPGADLDVEVFENGPPVEAPIAIKVVGPDLDVLADLAAKVEAAVEATPGTEDVENPLAQPRTDLRVAVDRERAGLLGVSLAALDQTVLAALAGLPVATYRDAANDDVPVVVRLPYDAATDDPDGETRRPTLSDLDRVSVTAASGARVPLGQLATVRLEREPSQIDHVDLERAVTVTADAVPGTNEIAVTTAVLDRLDGLALPPGYRLQVGGKLEAQQESFGALGGALAVAMLAIFGVLVLQFRSLLQPLVVFAAIPLSAAGAFPALALTGVSFSFMAFIGLTSLVGIVVNNSILLVDTANRLRDAGDAVEDAVRGAARSRFAPILLTTMTTVGGLTPLLLTNSDLWTPLAAVIVGGLLASTGLTLLVVPVLYRLLTRDEAGGAETGGADGERTDTNGTADADPDAPGTTGASASASGDGLPAEPARPPVGGDEA